jgi:DNA-binding transcriptional LysR family regulator
MAALSARQFIVYEASTGAADPTRAQLSARAQVAGIRLEPRLEVEAVETALRLAAEGVADTYVPEVLVETIDPRLLVARFDPPLVDTFVLVTRTGARHSTWSSASSALGDDHGVWTCSVVGRVSHADGM